MGLSDIDNLLDKTVQDETNDWLERFGRPHGSNQPVNRMTNLLVTIRHSMENILENTNQRITTLRRTRNASQADIIENKA